jgi:hypothetical protein
VFPTFLWALTGAAYWQLQVPAPVTSDLRAALDGVEELEPELELGSVCGWAGMGGWPDPEDVELEDGELEPPDCCVVSTASDVPLADDAIVLDERDPRLAGVRNRVGR